ncbi:glutathione S-transferase family protein [Sphingomonadaceae bacterium OTU29THOMA1]|nr:glutathione S-transferase family protein [Sphingomonadaceae bacterium OTU29THOMA1]
MIPTITAFAQSPDRGRGLARDMAVRWALEEVGQPYEVRLLSFAALKEPAHRALQPFGQIPTYEEAALTLFESAAIVLRVAEQHPGLLPHSTDARAQAIAWMFAAKSTVEPPIVERSMALLLEADRPWHAERLTMLDERVRTRLDDLSRWLAYRDWLEEAFSAADVVMVTVLRRLGGSGFLEEQPTIASYVARGEARPAFKRAFEAQRAVFAAAEA